jgi:hypothetical protein
VICTEFGEWQAPGETPSHTDEVEGVFIWSFHGCAYEEYRILGCDTARLLKNPRSGGASHLHHQSEKNQQAHREGIFLRNMLQVLVTANFIPISLILFTLMMEAICSSGKWVLTGATWRHVPDDGILYSEI